mgnify:CR=1 FL=1
MFRSVTNNIVVKLIGIAEAKKIKKVSFNKSDQSIPNRRAATLPGKIIFVVFL